MAGTYEGGVAAAATNRAVHGPDFYSRIGKLGGKKGHTGGFHASKDRAITAGKLGGQRSRRGYKLIKANNGLLHYIHVASGERVTFREDAN